MSRNQPRLRNGAGRARRGTQRVLPQNRREKHFEEGMIACVECG